jgi:hypothetical protein
VCCACVVRVAWRGVAWRGVAWRGVAWRGVIWPGPCGVTRVCAGGKRCASAPGQDQHLPTRTAKKACSTPHARNAPKCSLISTALKPTTGMLAASEGGGGGREGRGGRACKRWACAATRRTHAARAAHATHSHTHAPHGHAHAHGAAQETPHTPARHRHQRARPPTCEQRADDDERRKRDVVPRRGAPAHDARQRVDGDEVDDERVAAPGEHHVEVRAQRGRRPAQRARVDRLAWGAGCVGGCCAPQQGARRAAAGAHVTPLRRASRAAQNPAPQRPAPDRTRCPRTHPGARARTLM